MARKARLHAPGAVYHVILRGNSKQDIFGDDKDRLQLCSVLDASCKRFDHRIHAFCLMTNHVHLQIQVGRIPLSRIMQNVSQRYTQWFNSRYKRCGHLFQGRYKAVMVDSDEYLLELAAYIHLNPVRAGITDHPARYQWSSHSAYTGKGSYPWLETRLILSEFSTNAAKSQKMFSKFVDDRIFEGRRRDFHGESIEDSRVLGDDQFLEVVLSEAESSPLHRPDIEVIIAVVKEIYKVTDAQLTAPSQQRYVAEARAVAAWAVQELGSGSLRDLGRRFRRDGCSLTSAIRRIEIRRKEDPVLADKMEQLRQHLVPPPDTASSS